ncbi:MAG: DUF2163 domain-containing protein [Pacificimonas sp.]
MRQVSDALAASLAAPVTSLAWLWRVVRADGVALGFTTHDRALRVGGMAYHPAPGMVPSAVSESDGADVEGVDVSGVLSSDFITAADIEAGRYDGARAKLMLVDWAATDSGVLFVTHGTLGAIRVQNGRFEAELRTAETLLNAVPVELTTPECRARLGDGRCGVDLAARRREVVVSEILDVGEVRVAPAPGDGLFAYGRMRALSGALAGVDVGIARNVDDILVLDDDARGLAVGDRLLLTEGCDRRWTTCRGRFGNGDNFRGEPFVPGRDSVLRYPGL